MCFTLKSVLKIQPLLTTSVADTVARAAIVSNTAPVALLFLKRESARHTFLLRALRSLPALLRGKAWDLTFAHKAHRAQALMLLSAHFLPLPPLLLPLWPSRLSEDQPSTLLPPRLALSVPSAWNSLPSQAPAGLASSFLAFLCSDVTVSEALSDRPL